MERSDARRGARRQLRRHPAGGGYARGERTRSRIIEAAIDMFGESGYEGTSTRAIARRAAVSLPALQYYFGGKAGLHRACAGYITADVHERLAPAVRAARRALAAPRLSHAELLQLLRSVVEPFLDGMARDRPDSWVMFFTRVQSGGSPAFGVIFERVAGPMIEVCTAIIGRILRREPHDPEVLIRSVSIIGQLATMRRVRPLVLRALKWPDFGGSRLAVLKRVLWRQFEASLTPTGRRALTRQRSSSGASSKRAQTRRSPRRGVPPNPVQIERTATAR